MSPNTVLIPPLTSEQEAYLDEIQKRSEPSKNDLKNILIPGPNFDPDLSPQNERNERAAQVRNWTFDENKRMYRDKDGALVADQFGQLL